MPAYTFTFDVGDTFGLDCDDDLDTLFENFHDVSAGSIRNVTTIDFIADADTAHEALLDTHRRLTELFPNIEVRRLDRHLVDVDAIADYTNLDCDTITGIVTGNDPPFCDHTGVLTGGVLIWELADVAAWFAKHREPIDPFTHIDPDTAARFDAYLANTR